MKFFDVAGLCDPSISYMYESEWMNKGKYKGYTLYREVTYHDGAWTGHMHYCAVKDGKPILESRNLDSIKWLVTTAVGGGFVGEGGRKLTLVPVEGHSTMTGAFL